MESIEKISLYKIIKSLSYSMDLINETIIGHHKKVAYMSLQLGKEMNLTKDEIQKLIMAALIHDLGVFYLNQSFSDLTFDNKNNQHAEIGYQLLQKYFPIPEISEIILYHHQN